MITDDVESIFWHDVSVQRSPLRENVPPEYSGVGFTHFQHSRIFGKLGFIMIKYGWSLRILFSTDELATLCKVSYNWQYNREVTQVSSRD